MLSRYDLYLADTLTDRYDWSEAAHPRNEAGASGGVGGQFRPSEGGNRPGGSLSPRMLGSAQEKWKSTGSKWETVESPAVKQLRKVFADYNANRQGSLDSSRPASGSTKLRDVGERKPVKAGHALHTSSLASEWQSKLRDWSNALSREMMSTIKPPTESRFSDDEYFEREWAKIDKNKIRGLLDQMNQLDRQARASGVRLADYVNANGMIPQRLAERLQGGARFFDQSRIADKIQAGEGKSQETADPLRAYRDADRKAQREMEKDPAVMAAIHKSLGLTPPKPKSPAEPKPEPMTPFVDLGSGLSTRHQNLIDAALTNRADVSPDELPNLRQQVLDTWKRMNDERKQHNEGLRSVMSTFGIEGAKRSALTTALRRGSDYDKIPGFDEMVSWARNNLPHILVQHAGESDTGSDEESLAKAIVDGQRDELQPWHDEVIDELGMQLSAAMSSYKGPAIDESVPFSIRFTAEVERYRNRRRKSSVAIVA